MKFLRNVHVIRYTPDLKYTTQKAKSVMRRLLALTKTKKSALSTRQAIKNSPPKNISSPQPGAHHPAQHPSQSHLTPQLTCIHQPKRHIQHIVLVIPRLCECVVVLWREADVAGLSFVRVFACAFEVDAVAVHQGKDVVAFTSFDDDDFDPV